MNAAKKYKPLDLWLNVNTVNKYKPKLKYKSKQINIYSSMSMRSKRKVPSPLLSKFCFSSQPAVNPTFSMQSDPWYPNISNSKLKLKAWGHEINWAHEIDWAHTIPISLSVASFFKELGGKIAPSKVVLGREFSNRMMKN